MGGFGNFAISFTIISILAGCLTSYFIAFKNGGPVAVTWGWLLVGGFCIIVALAMAEIASSMPTAGGLYYWASKLGKPGLGLVHGLVQPDRPDLRDRGDRLRRGDVRLVAAQPLVRHVADEGARVHRLHGDHPAPPRDQYLRPERPQPAQHGLCLVAHGGRRDHRPDPDRHPRPPPVGLVRVHEDAQHLRVLGRRLLEPGLLVRAGKFSFSPRSRRRRASSATW